MIAPKLRFREFNTDYTNTTFEKLKGFSIQSGKSEEKGDTGVFPFYGSTGVIGHKDIFDYEGKSILIARVGANAGSLYQIDGKYSVSDNTLRLTVSDGTNLDYLRELLIKFNLNRLVFGTGQPLVTGGMIKKVNIFIPEFTEQTKIASFLSAVDEKINQLTQKHQLLSQYKQGMMQKLFSQQIRFKADDGSEFAEWESRTLAEVGENIIGLTYSPTDVTNDGSGILVLRSSNIKNGRLNKNDQVRVNKKIKDKILVQPNDILICTRNGSQRLIGKSVIINDNEVMTFGAFMSVYRSQYNRFIAYLMQTPWFFEQIQMNLGARINQITTGTLNEFTFDFPCLEEQTKIANFLSSIDQKIEVTAQQIEQAKQWKKGLLQQMFV